MNRVIDGLNVSWDGSDLEFSMTEAGLDELVHVFESNLSGIFRIGRAGSADNVSLLEVVRSDGKIMLRVTSDRASFSGGESAFGLLVDNMRILKKDWGLGRAGHIHFDPASDPLILEMESDAFVLSRSG